jgi:prepilin-type N-terminal cleavage/methylation domain-containing protein
MNSKLRNNKAFTLIELLVAIAILAIVLSFAGVIFRVSADSQRTAAANTEIMQKLRAITDQLNSDFKGLRKDGEILFIWEARPKAGFPPSDPNSYERFDRIMFFADGDFQSYNAIPNVIRGNLARISYMLAKNRIHQPAEAQPKEKRILARTQHILTADPDRPAIDPGTFSTDQQWYNWHNLLEYDKMTMEEWKNILLTSQKKQNMLSVITDITIGDPTVNEAFRGAHADPADPDTIHILLCEGVGEFEIQGWSYDPRRGRWRWIPDVDPDGNGNVSDMDFYLNDPIDPNQVPGVYYPYFVSINGINDRDDYYFTAPLNEDNFDIIPGLGRALKFTFTLYDSKGVIKNGRTFTHIVYLN